MNFSADFFSRHQKLVLFVLSLTLLMMNFCDHRLSTLSTERFAENEFPSEAFIIHRLIYNLSGKSTDFGGLPIKYQSDDLDRDFNKNSRHDFRDYQNKVEQEIGQGNRPNIYPSHAAMQLRLLEPVWKGAVSLRDRVTANLAPDSKRYKLLHDDFAYILYRISQGLAALLTASVLTGFVFWVRREFSQSVAILTLAGILILCPPITYFARNLWWLSGLMYLPMVIGFWGLALFRHHRKSLIWAMIGLVQGIAAFLRISCGYEYASTVMMSALVPVIYYGVKDQWTRADLVRAILIIGGLVFAGFVATIAYHIHVLDAAGIPAIETIKAKFLMRASGSEAAGLTQNDLIKESVDVSVFTVIAKYIFLPQRIAWPELVYLVPAVTGLWFLGKNNLKNDKTRLALVGALGASLIGALSMLVILKGHAYIHGFDVIVWYLPFNLILIVWGASEIVRRFRLTRV